jgi:hypothetical protein
VRLRFEVLPNRFLPRAIERGLAALALAVVFVPGIWILVGFIAVGHDAIGGLVLGGFFLVVAGVIARDIWTSAYEVIVDAGEVRWRGFAAGGRAPLGDLLCVRGAGSRSTRVVFVLTRLRAFNVLPAPGLGQFVDRLQAIAPDVQVKLRRSGWRSARRRRDVFEETD